MKLITGFFMAWGNFLTIPCPLKKWDNDLKNYMLGFLPAVGLIIGGLWTASTIFLVWFGTPFLVMAFLMTFLLFAMCGFMHLDGFMDCSDAIMSRKPIEVKQQILKDSHCGAFSIVSVLFMLLGYYSFIATALGGAIDFVDLIIIPVLSRSVAGLFVINAKPIGHSQYAEGLGANDNSQKKKASVLIVIQGLIACAVCLILASDIIPTLAVMGFSILGTLIAILYARKSLGGMSGDIAGFGIVWGELLGIFGMLIL